jgi:glycosyltransferase involved in cell wall biosynthesis
MKVAIYSPYLDTAGGGEKYILTIAETLSKDQEVDVLLDDHLIQLGIAGIKDKVEKLHGLNLSKVNFIKSPLGRGSNFLDKFFFLKKYDVLFYNTDGSIFYSTAKKNIIHFQVPFENVAAKGPWGKIKLSSWKLAIYNSKFTKDIIEKTWSIKGEVIYPPVSTELFKELKRKKQIVSVGRLVGDKTKKQSVLIEAFKKLNTKGWSLHIAGGVMNGDRDYINELKSLAKGFDVYFYENVSMELLQKLYGESSLYWHATGFEEVDPKKMEHFGITTVEAMAAGCVPVVINLGGQKEIVSSGIDGFLWNNEDELLHYTQHLIEDENLMREFSTEAKKKAQIFNKDKFCDSIRRIVNE